MEQSWYEKALRAYADNCGADGNAWSLEKLLPILDIAATERAVEQPEQMITILNAARDQAFQNGLAAVKVMEDLSQIKATISRIDQVLSKPLEASLTSDDLHAVTTAAGKR